MQSKPDSTLSGAPGKRNSSKPRKTGKTNLDTPVGARKKKEPLPATKGETVLALLRRKRGASLGELMTATGWQAHSVRAFLSAALRKRMALEVASEKNAKGVRRYFIANEPAA